MLQLKAEGHNLLSSVDVDSSVPVVAQLVVDVCDQTDFPTTFHDFVDSKNWVLAAGGHLDKQVFRNQARKVSVSMYIFC